jgi:hypothetical protein
MTVGELEKTLMFSQAEEGENHSKELLNIFSQEDEKTTALKLAVGEEEEEVGNIDFADLYQEFEALERRVMVQSLHIQQVSLETDEDKF